ncbi:MAG TPA: hypothetical protein DDZ80_26965, partial [Cyanobacteria bacterium UBA8803]|nr:hypothetical protein [Cyanobacteria bacterium UBA9273]HBL61918.1 hypothetical protein [Cyanobacteria bacterium UBA8803]
SWGAGGATVGYLWLINSPDKVLGEWEMRLVQEVAHQCAIALRQARLYQLVQARITQLEELKRSKDDFISLVAHELRSPMCGMRLSIQTLQALMLQGRKFCEEKADCNQYCTKSSKYIQILDKESERQINLLNNLLDLQRLETGHQAKALIPVKLNDWLAEVAEPFERRALARQQSLSVDLSADLPCFVCDSNSLRRILNELLNNACKYTPPGETITLNAAAASGTLQLRVCNSGVEIPAPELPRIFEKFYRVPDGDPWHQGGSGLGLVLVKGLVEQLGGNLQVESADQHTSFTVELPLVSQQLNPLLQ